MNTASVKVNLELGRSLRGKLEQDASASCRKLSWQVLYYIQRSLEHGPFIHRPQDTLDDNDGRFTAYVPEDTYNRLQDLAVSHNSNLSAVVRAAILHGIALDRKGGGA